MEICRDFNQGRCRLGDQCPRQHIEDPEGGGGGGRRRRGGGGGGDGGEDGGGGGGGGRKRGPRKPREVKKIDEVRTARLALRCPGCLQPAPAIPSRPAPLA